MTRALLVGYQGMGNLGDEAILSGIEVLLRDSPVEVTAVASGGLATITAFPLARRVPTPHFLAGRTFRQALRSADVMVMAGGGLMNDHWPTLLPRMLALVITARLFGTRVVWIAAGVGPLRTRRARWLARLVVASSAAVSVRDPDSDRLLRDIGAREPPVLPDPALFLEPPPGSAQPAGTAVVVRAPVSHSVAADTLIASIAEVASASAGTQAGATLLSAHHGVDSDVISQINQAVQSRVGRRLPVKELALDPQEALRELAAYEAVISVRLHGVVLAALADRPCVAVVYDGKVRSVGSMLGAPQLALEMRDLSAQRLRAALTEASSPAVRADVRAAVSKLRGHQAEARAWLLQALR